jgi:hypothetical protein
VARAEAGQALDVRPQAFGRDARANAACERGRVGRFLSQGYEEESEEQHHGYGRAKGGRKRRP